MSDFPLISIILPSYSHAEFVATAVESVLHQTIKDIELIVIDDGSSDGTPDRVERIHDPRLRLIRLGQNRLRHPRNLGLDLAQGQYVAFQNSDDIWLPEKLEIQLEVLKEHENVLACFTDVEIIDDEGNVALNSWANGLFTTENRSNILWLKRFFEIGNCLCLTSALVRRAALEKAGRFHGKYIQLSDFDLWVRFAALGEFHIVDKKLTCFRDTTGRKKNFPDSLGNQTSTTGNGNLSSPNANSQNRSVLEYATVLENYINPPILDMLPQIFPDIMQAEPSSQTAQLTRLVKHAWSLNSIPHALFADSVMARIMDDESIRKEATDVFGAEIIQEFVRRRGNMAIRFEDQLTDFSAQLTDKDRSIQNLSMHLADRDRSIQNLSMHLADRDLSIQNLFTQLTDKDQSIQTLLSQLTDKDCVIQNISAQLSVAEQNLNSITHSRSWKITFPLRIIGSAFRKLKWQNDKRS